jgi:hypothetical protein
MEFGISLYDALVNANVAPDKAKTLVQALEKEMFDKLASKQDLLMLETRLKHDLTLRVGGMIAAGFTLMVTITVGMLKLIS